MKEPISLEIDYDSTIKGFIDKTLPKEQWTHDAHLFTGLWHVINFDAKDALYKMRVRIKTYNELVGGINSETSGYHETITVFWVWALNEYKNHNFTEDSAKNLDKFYEDFLKSKFADRNLALNFYSKEKLASVEARMNFVEPDLQALDFSKIS